MRSATRASGRSLHNLACSGRRGSSSSDSPGPIERSASEDTNLGTILNTRSDCEQHTGLRLRCFVCTRLVALHSASLCIVGRHLAPDSIKTIPSLPSFLPDGAKERERERSPTAGANFQLGRRKVSPCVSFDPSSCDPTFPPEFPR